LRRLGRNEVLLLASTFVAFAWFHQGGQWNQNARFALVRAIVEEGSFFIDSHIVYLPDREGDVRFRRAEVRDGEFEYAGRTYALGWIGAGGALTPIAGAASPDATLLDAGIASVSGDVAYHDGHFHPNKAPGPSFMAVPAYFLLYYVERALSLDPDAWWTLTLNAWLTSALTVGLLSALGVVLFHRFALRVSNGDERAAGVTALTWAFGTMFFPYGTMLFEHNLIAVALLASWYCAYRARESANGARRYLVLAGLCAGLAAISNNIMAVPVVMIGAYVLMARIERGWLWMCAGLLGPFLLITSYNAVCFGSPFATNYAYMNPGFMEDGGLLSVFGVPRPGVLASILFSPFRGLFVTSPVLILGVAGLGLLWKIPRLRADALLCTSICVFLLLFNTTFNGWHGGWAVLPRYLGPAVPFLALPIVLVYRRLPRGTVTLAALSTVIMFVITAVDAQAPIGISSVATAPGRPQWTYSPVTEYELPLLLGGSATPLLADIERRGGDPRILATVEGPVSANPIGVYEGGYYQRFAAEWPQPRWNSFNVGEFFLPNSRWSLLPLLLVSGGIAVAFARRTAGTAPRNNEPPPPVAEG
jgi:hypothetical protein